MTLIQVELAETHITTTSSSLFNQQDYIPSSKSKIRSFFINCNQWFCCCLLEIKRKIVTTSLDFGQSLMAPGPTSHSTWTTNTLRAMEWSTTARAGLIGVSTGINFCCLFEDILRPSNWEPSSTSTVMDLSICNMTTIVQLLGTDVVGEVIVEAQPYIYCLKGFRYCQIRYHRNMR
ncbi:hypothetical protein OIU76_021702 [Salix suchowensis]|nr:hypothetical protein OIU76_021702 [Salix suchowensis]